MSITLDPELYREAADFIEQNGWWAGLDRGYFLPDGTPVPAKASGEDQLDFRDPRISDCHCAYTAMVHIAKERGWIDPYGDLRDRDGYVQHYVDVNGLWEFASVNVTSPFRVTTTSNDRAPDAATVCGWLRHAADALEPT